MSNYIRRVVYPRETNSGLNEGWLGFEARIRIHAEPQAQQAGSFRLGPRRHRFSVYHHGFWQDQLGWIVHPQAAGFNTAWVPAFAQQLESFRTRRPPHIRPNRVGGVRERVDPTTVVAALDQLLGGFRTPARDRFSLAHHSWVDDAAAILANVPEVAFVSAFEQLLASYVAPRRKAHPRDLLLWDVNRRMAGAFSEDPTIFAPATDQLAESLILRRRRGLDVRQHDFYQEGWLSVFERDDTAVQRPAQDQLLASFRVDRRARYSPWHLDSYDLGSWLSHFSTFDETLWPPIGDLLGSFRSAQGARLDVRRQDAPFDAWLSTEPIFAVPLFAPALQGLAEGFRSPSRRATMDLYGSEWQHDLAWLKETLALEDIVRQSSLRRLLLMGVGT